MRDGAGAAASPQRLCSLAELPDGGARGFEPAEGGERVFAVRRGNAVHVWLDRCPHQGTPLPWRRDAYLNAAGNRIVCAAHGAQFEVDTGLCVLGPCLGDRLQPVPFHIDDDGGIVLAENGA